MGPIEPYVLPYFPVEIVAISEIAFEIFRAIKRFILLCGHFMRFCIELKCFRKKKKVTSSRIK